MLNMFFKIHHYTSYRYSSPVRLNPQLLRFRPREDGAQHITDYRIHITPTPVGQNDHLDLEGNRVSQVWFDGETDLLEIDVNIQVETRRRDAFDFMLAPEVNRLPISLVNDRACARAYLERIHSDDAVTAFAAELSLAVERDTRTYLDRLNQELFNRFEHIIRHHGEPQDPAHTLQTRRGACRDLSVLFVDCCRAEGIPARFASGYQRGDDKRERRYLHAWPEVYLPGAGWRGFDPTHAEAITDTHVTVAAAAHPRDTMPLTGSFSGTQVTSHLDFTLDIEATEQVRNGEA